MKLAEQVPPRSLRMDFRVDGRLGNGGGSAWVTLAPEGAGTKLAYRYGFDVGGTVAAVGNRMLGSVTGVLIGQFFKAFEAKGATKAAPGELSLWQRLLRWLGLDGGGR